MKQALLLLLLLGFGQVQAKVLLPERAHTQITATEKGYTINLSFGDVSVKDAGSGWQKLVMPGTFHTLNAGAPEMVYKSFSLLLPEGDVEVKVVSSSYVYYNDIDIIPSKGNLVRNIDPATVPLVTGAEYQQDVFYPVQSVELGNAYNIRKAHGRTVHVYPVQYNPLAHTVRVCIDMQIEVITRHAAKPVESVGMWDKIYKRQFLNYDLLETVAAKSTYSAPTETGDMLIVTQGQYIGALQNFINWKQERGIHCFIMNMDTVTSGADPDSIQARIAWHYQQNNNLNYVVLVGDESDIPAMENVDLAGPSDAAYGYVAGNDHYPDLLVGRFSANTLLELQPQLSKSIEYEKNPTISQAWYTRGLGIASNQGPGDDGQMDWEHINAIRAQLLAADYTYIYEAYDGTHDINIAPLDNAGDPDAQEIVDAINSGISLVNYCGHGSSTSLGTSGFSNGDVADLTNTNGEWPFIMTVACVTGEFMNGNTSLGEKLMTATQGGQPYGMVAGYMSSINQYWDPPMEAQDEVNNIISGNDSNKLYEAGALMAAGAMSMNDAYAGAGYDMTDAWIFFGDPSLQLRYKASDTLTAVHADSIFFYETNTGVDINKQYGTVVLMHDGEIYSVETATSFNTSHTFAALPVGDSLIVVATSPNTKPYYGKIRIVDTLSVPVAIANVNQENNLVLYPNPARNIVTVKGIAAETTFRCLDITGRLVLEGKLDAANNRLNTGNIPVGSYILQLESKGHKTNLPLQILR